MIDLRSVTRLAVLFLACSLLGASAAQAQIKKGDTLLLFQLTNGDVSLAAPAGAGITSYSQTEWGGGIQIQHLVSEDWAFVLGGGIGTFKETDTPPASSLEATTEYKQSSWNMRLGADRVVHISPSVHFFTGPGLFYFSGRGKFDDGSGFVEWPRAKQIGLDGRLGAHVAIGPKWGLSGQISRWIAHASAKDGTGLDEAKATWWPSGSAGQVGLFFNL